MLNSSHLNHHKFLSHHQTYFIKPSIFLLLRQQITIPIAQFVESANHASKLFFRIADALLLLHFTFDPYIYVIMRTDYWKKIKNFILNQFRFKEQDELAEMF